jgi:hypothetical protein
MKIVVLIARLLLGLVFFVFGLNAFLQFLKGPIPGGLAGQFLQALSSRTMGWRSAQCRRLAARLDLYRKGFPAWLQRTFAGLRGPQPLIAARRGRSMPCRRLAGRWSPGDCRHRCATIFAIINPMRS